MRERYVQKVPQSISIDDAQTIHRKKGVLKQWQRASAYRARFATTQGKRQDDGDSIIII